MYPRFILMLSYQISEVVSCLEVFKPNFCMHFSLPPHDTSHDTYLTHAMLSDLITLTILHQEKNYKNYH